MCACGYVLDDHAGLGCQALVFFLFSFRACLYGGGGPQAGEVTCLEAWGNLACVAGAGK